jgi:transposase InsO family protein
VRTQKRRERAAASPSAGSARASEPEVEHGFRRAAVADGGCIGILTVADQFTCECLVLHADNTLGGEKVAIALDKAVALRGAPESITVDNGTEFTSKALDLWAYENSVHLDFIRPGKPVEKGYIESFNGKLRGECLDVEVFFTLAHARREFISGGATINTSVHTLRLRIERQPSSPPLAAEEKTAITPPWKTLRVSHFTSARRRRFERRSKNSSSPLLEAHT